MIGKLTKKDKLALLYITLLTLFAVVYGFSIIPSPLKQQIIVYDQQRVVDLGEIQSAIDNYYQLNNNLPKSLNDISNTYDPSTQLNLTDPQTKQPYEYTIIDTRTYHLCATFAYSSTDEKPSDTSETTTNLFTYPSFRNQFKHPTGHYCFTKHEIVPFYMRNHPTKIRPTTIYNYQTATPSSYGTNVNKLY